MKYISIVKKNEKEHRCPFCHEKEEHMLQKGKYFYVIPARAPYVKDHILIIPKRHVNMLTTLNPAELLEMHKLIDIRAKKLHKKYKGVNILLRDGLTKDQIINKSVNHLHVHLLANVGIHIKTKEKQSPNNREWLLDKEYDKLTQTMKKTFLAK